VAKQRIVVTDLTRMSGERVCLAGYPLDAPERDRCVRPEFRYGSPTESWLFARGTVAVRPFAVVELDLLEHRPDPPHTEDWIVDERCRRPHGLLPEAERRTLLDRLDDGAVAAIFGAEIHQDPAWWVAAGTGNRSLGTVRPANVAGIVFAQKPGRPTWDYRLVFDDAAGRRYNLAVTDLAFRFHLDHLRDREGLSPARAIGATMARLRAAEAVFVRVGLTRGFGDRPNRRHLQITGVYSFPDYLGGRCFADFPTYQEELARRNSLDDVPF
jgi:hypothetical protein